jgi:Enoyl-(Acyl carrier protein) reductase
MAVLQAAERHNFTVVEDDIFCDLQVRTTPRLATLDQLNRVIYARSFSKTLSGSLWVVSGADADRVLGVIRNRFASVQPIPRAGETDDIAQAAVVLASDASSFITGQDIAVDGGMVPFGNYGWHESVGLRADVSRLVEEEIARQHFTSGDGTPDDARRLIEKVIADD